MVVLRPLKRRKEIEQVWTYGQRVSSEMLVLVALCRAGEDGGKLGYVVSVSRRRERRAVVRSRLRRVLREALRLTIREIAAQEGRIPFAALAVVWRGVGLSPRGQVRLWDVLPQLRQLVWQAWEKCR